MGTFYIGCRIENHVDRKKSAKVPKLLVDTGREYTWINEKTLEKINVAPEKKDVTFVMANGQIITRTVGFAIIRVNKEFTIDEVVFALRGDMQLLGARTLEGLNLTVNSRAKKTCCRGAGKGYLTFKFLVTYNIIHFSGCSKCSMLLAFTSLINQATTINLLINKLISRATTINLLVNRRLIKQAITIRSLTMFL